MVRDNQRKSGAIEFGGHSGALLVEAESVREGEIGRRVSQRSSQSLLSMISGSQQGESHLSVHGEFQLSQLAGRAIDIWWAEARDAATHTAIHTTACYNNYPSKMSTC